MTATVLTEDTLKALEELVEKKAEIVDRIEKCRNDLSISHENREFAITDYEDELIEIAHHLRTTLYDKAAELIRGYRLGIALDKDRKP